MELTGRRGFKALNSHAKFAEKIQQRAKIGPKNKILPVPSLLIARNREPTVTMPVPAGGLDRQFGSGSGASGPAQRFTFDGTSAVAVGYGAEAIGKNVALFVAQEVSNVTISR